jgi:hypothetical protein
VLLCPTCAGFAPFTTPDYAGFLSSHCQGCGQWHRECHRFAADIDSAAGCKCRGGHDQVVGDLAADKATVGTITLSGEAPGGAGRSD